MKTPIALPAVLRSAAETFARQHGVTRQELFAEAVREYMIRHRSVSRPTPSALPQQAAHKA